MDAVRARASPGGPGGFVACSQRVLGVGSEKWEKNKYGGWEGRWGSDYKRVVGGGVKERMWGREGKGERGKARRRGKKRRKEKKTERRGGEEMGVCAARGTDKY